MQMPVVSAHAPTWAGLSEPKVLLSQSVAAVQAAHFEVEERQRAVPQSDWPLVLQSVAVH